MRSLPLLLTFLSLSSMATAPLAGVAQPPDLPLKPQLEPHAHPRPHVFAALRWLRQANQHYRQRHYRAAIDSYEQALAIYQALRDRQGQARVLNLIGAIYDQLADYRKATAYYQQALTHYQALGAVAETASVINSLGGVAQQQNNYGKAEQFYQQALSRYQTMADLLGEAQTLNNLGALAYQQSQYGRSLKAYQQALRLFNTRNDLKGTGAVLNNLGLTYHALGQYAEALNYYRQSLALRQQIQDLDGVGTTLHNLGFTYAETQQNPQAVDAYQQALAVRRQLDDRAGEALTLNNLGVIYERLNQPIQALQTLEAALLILQTIQDSAGIGHTLDSIGRVYQKQGQSKRALAYYQQSLAVRRTVGDHAGERNTLAHLGELVEPQQPELAIVFYKQAVNLTETIRDDLRTLPRSLQESYTQTIAATYRTLANLLLSQGRLVETQQVLELLKIQEIREFTRSPLTGNRREVHLSAAEQRILNEHGSLIAFGQKIQACKSVRCEQLSQFNDQLDALTQTYIQRVKVFEQAMRQRRSQDPNFLDPSKLLLGAKAIVEAQPGTVLIYPLVLSNKLWLVWASGGVVINSTEVNVSERELGETVLQFRQLIEDPTSNRQQIQAIGKRLYDWLVQPLAAELKANQIQHLVFSLDRVTRYIPMSALFDGKQYLVENYTISTILAADLTNVTDRLPPGIQDTTVLALGASEFQSFNPLPNVPAELDAIVLNQANDRNGIYPGLALLNQAFNFRSLRDQLLGHRILHIATHGIFVPGRPEDSYLVLGDGEKLTIDQIKTLQDLSGVHLVVLSACETALGGPDQDGVEISGMSSYFLTNGASAVLASLWSVNDVSTSELMQRFYQHLASSTPQVAMTKAAALRQAQLNLLYEPTPPAAQRGRGIGVTPKPTVRFSKGTIAPYTHPFYWAAFTLIGNRL